MLDLHPNTQEWNDLCARVHAREKDGPGKTWWNAQAGHPAIYRALKVDPNEFGAFYAILPFRLARIEGQPRILAAHPCPLTLGPIDEDWLSIEAVISWNPVDNTATVLRDKTPQLVGDLNEPVLFGDPFAFFRSWVEARAAFAMHRSHTAGKEWASPPTEYGTAPGALIVGDADKIRWAPSAMPRDLAVVGIDPIKINRAILRAANLPRAVAKQANLRAVA